MGTRQSEQSSLWVATSELPTSPGHPFYARLNALLDAHDFDQFVEGLCRKFYAKIMGRPSLQPGRYFRLLLLGYFEGLDSERGIAWARERLVDRPQFPAPPLGRGAPRSFDDLSHATRDRS